MKSRRETPRDRLQEGLHSGDGATEVELTLDEMQRGPGGARRVVALGGPGEWPRRIVKSGRD